MSFDIPFAYTAKASRRDSARSEFIIGASMRVDPANALPEDAPVAVRHAGFCAVAVDVNGRATRETPANGRVAIRHFWDGFYEPLRIRVDGREAGAAAARNPRDSADLAACLCDLEAVQAYAERGDRRMLREDTKAAVDFTNRASSHAEVRKAAESLLFVDGVLHRRVGEPVYVLDAVGAVSVAPLSDIVVRSLQAFRLDETEALMRVADATSPAAGASARLAVAQVEVVDLSPWGFGSRDEKLKRDLAENGLLMAAKKLADAIAVELHAHPLETVLAYDDLRTVYEPRWTDDRYDMSVDYGRLLDTVLAVCPVVAGTPTIPDAGRLAAETLARAAAYRTRVAAAEPDADLDEVANIGL
jgi:hypothetical protein